MVRLTREEIYQLVWEQPMIEIAKKYTVSDVGFRKMCLRMDIPIPVVGHWAKVRAGQKENRPKLPSKFKGIAFVDLEERPSDRPVKTASEKHKLAKKISNERLPFKVPDRLTKPDPLTVASKESLAKMKDLNYPGMAVTGRKQLDIRVSPNSVGRALRFMDTLIKCVRIRGHQYEAQNDGNYVIIREIKLKVKFRELTTKIRIHNRQYKDFEWRANGKLVFRLDGTYRAEWKDLKLQMLEDQLPRILAKLEVVAKQEEEDKVKARIWQENWERQRKAEAEREARQIEELKKFKELMSVAKRWKQAQLLREYISSKPSRDEEWLAWASHKADWLDPNINAKDEWMAGVDKNTQ